MSKYKLSTVAKEDLIRIHHYGVRQFGMKQADRYFESFFVHFELIAKNPQSFESVDYIKPGYRRCVCGVDSIFFKMNKDVVEIMTIIGRQDLNQLL
ncbi:MAG: type II toxin-antitoxin system RelE/ParE family toxin [Cryomorphaceae bacterium]|nr:type II toxin-antitoxin system RelE/ParE family toxin [Cryomorphaceae bacterium]